ncbi:MAG TPA: molybdopterin-dependent oxidoreductase [Gaiellaceae bacterium]|nr:molybdopterin-dependent oxidoreductase [Gaiellaceae bacterium]
MATVTIDDRAVEVPKGLGLVETAQAAGIEIPVFCYEPRLGAAVGACRMCLVEIEGMPKLQAGCTMTAQDGMVVKTAQTSERAAAGQNGTLEFLLLNHPLDCPVCDKGGECPLQDLTFRYGPGATRMQFPKRTFDKPIPISPAISLDRDRCIMCFRCTRFSQDVAEDGQLVARERGSHSMIATFEDEPYRAPFSGNVTELCPVGALLPIQYRFEARPWEIQNVPTVCGLCPVGCNTQVSTREGQAKRVLSRNHPEVDQGWLCDKGRFGFSHLYADDRIAEPQRRAGRRRFEPVAWEEALDLAEQMLRKAGSNVVTAFSGTESSEQAWALAKLLRRGLGAHAAVLPEQPSDALDGFALPLSAIRDAQLVVVVGDDPVVERAPIVDLWLKAARRNGAEVVVLAPAKETPAEQCASLPAGELGARLRAADRAIVIWSGDGPVDCLAALAGELGLAAKPGSGAFYLPRTPNGRGVVDAWAAAADEEPDERERIGLLLVSGDEAAADPAVRALAEKADAVLAIGLFLEPLRGLADLVLPATSYLEREGTTMNLEGRLQRQRRTVMAPCPDETAWLAKLGERFGLEISPYPSVLFDELAEACYPGTTAESLGEIAPLPPRAAARPVETPAPAPRAKAAGGGFRLLRYRPLFSGPAVERVPELQFQRPSPEVELSREDAARLGIERGALVRVSQNGTSVDLRAQLSRALPAGVVRIAEEHAGDLEQRVQLSLSPEAKGT